jgi:arylsulfatase A-like enzyme
MGGRSNLNTRLRRKPFFLALGISKPHLAWHVPQEFFDMHPVADVIVPEIHLDDLDDIIDAKGKKKFRPSEDFLRIQKYDKFKEVTQAYLAACSYADACIGVTLDALNKSQYKDNTIVVIWGDHGWFIG